MGDFELLHCRCPAQRSRNRGGNGEFNAETRRNAEERREGKIMEGRIMVAQLASTTTGSAGIPAGDSLKELGFQPNAPENRATPARMPALPVVRTRCARRSSW